MSVRRVGPWMLAAALIAASGLVLLLSRRLHDLSADYHEVRLLSTLPHAGTVVPTFRTVTLAMGSVTVGEAADSAARQVLLVFNTTCPYCLRHHPGLASDDRLGHAARSTRASAGDLPGPARHDATIRRPACCSVSSAHISAAEARALVSGSGRAANSCARLERNRAMRENRDP